MRCVAVLQPVYPKYFFKNIFQYFTSTLYSKGLQRFSLRPCHSAQCLKVRRVTHLPLFTITPQSA